MDVMFLHGLGQGPSSWEAVAAQLEAHITAVCPDLYGIAKGGGMGYSALYRAFSDYCGAYGGDAAHLCGLSLGSVLSLQYALEHPERVRSLVLIGGRARMPKGLLRLQNVLFRWMGEGSFREMGLSKAETIALTSSMADLDFRGRLSEVQCPTLVLCGERDTANRKDAAALAAGIPGAKCIFLPGAGHEVNRQTPEALAMALNDFYKSL